MKYPSERLRIDGAYLLSNILWISVLISYCCSLCALSSFSPGFRVHSLAGPPIDLAKLQNTNQDFFPQMPTSDSPCGKKKPSDLYVQFRFKASSAAESVAKYSHLANEISTYINQRSSKIVIITEKFAGNTLDLRFLVRIPEGITPDGVKKFLNGTALSRSNVEKRDTWCTVAYCDSNQIQLLDSSESAKIEWKFPGASFQAETLASRDVQPQSKVRAFSPRNATEASPCCWPPVPAVLLGSFFSHGAKQDLSLSSGENSQLRVTAAGTFPFLFKFIAAKSC